MSVTLLAVKVHLAEAEGVRIASSGRSGRRKGVGWSQVSILVIMCNSPTFQRRNFTWQRGADHVTWYKGRRGRGWRQVPIQVVCNTPCGESSFGRGVQIALPGFTVLGVGVEVRCQQFVTLLAMKVHLAEGSRSLQLVKVGARWSQVPMVCNTPRGESSRGRGETLGTFYLDLSLVFLV